MRNLAVLAFCIALVLSGCMSPAALKINEGKAASDRGEYVEAERLTREGLQLSPTTEERAAGINNLGHFAAQRGDREGAIRAFTLAARLGDATAQNNLLALGVAVPPADLVTPTAGSGGGADAALLLFLAAQQRDTCTHQTVGSYGVTRC